MIGSLLAAGSVLAVSLLYGLGTVNPSAPRWAALYLILAAAVSIGSWRAMRRGGFSLNVPDGFALLFCAWAFVSIDWSGDSWQGFFQLLNLLTLAGVYFIVGRVDREGIQTGVALSLMGAAVLCYWLPYNQYAGFGNRNFLTEFVVIAVPLGMASRFWTLKASSLLIGLYYLAFVDTGSARLLVAGAILISGAVLLWRHGQRFAAALLVLIPANVGLLFGVQQGVLYSLRTRLELWTNTLFMWGERPLLGQGFGSFNYQYPRFQEAHLAVFPEMGSFLNPVSMYAGASHNEFLQLGAELGLIGFVIATLFVVGLIWNQRWERSEAGWYGAASLILAGALSLTGFPMQNPCTAFLIAIACGFMGRGYRAVTEIPKRGGYAVPMFGCALGVSLVVTGWFYFVSQVEFSRARLALMAGEGAPAFVYNMRAIELFPYDWLARYQLGLSLTYLSVSDGKSVIEPAAADRINELTLSASPWSPSSRLARVTYLMNSNRFDERREEIERTMSDLKRTASKQGAVWITDALVSAHEGNSERFTTALNTGLRVANKDDPARLDLENIARQIASNEVRP